MNQCVFLDNLSTEESLYCGKVANQQEVMISLYNYLMADLGVNGQINLGDYGMTLRNLTNEQIEEMD